MNLCCKKTTLFSIMIFALAWNSLFSALPEWTVLVYAQAGNNLNLYASQNFTDMTQIGSTEDLNVLVQCYRPNQDGAFRYKILKGKMDLDMVVPTGDGHQANDLVGAMDWAVKKYPAQKYCLILWNHGLGIIDPLWGNNRRRERAIDSPLLSIENDVVKENPRIQIQGLTVDPISLTENKEINLNESLFGAASLSEIGQTNLVDFLPSMVHRGILFNEYTKTYMTNQILTQALSQIKTTVLNNKKIDVLGMDACLMAMVEVGYQARNYADLMVASQEVEHARGWNYLSILQGFSRGKPSPAQVAQNIVTAYDLLYKDRVNFYTQSAVKLEFMEEIRQSLDLVIHDVKVCQKLNAVETKDLIKRARKKALQFSMQSFIDLHTFLGEMQNQTDVDEHSSFIKSKQIQDLKISLSVCMRFIEESVVANVSGRYVNRAKGLSIYFPLTRIDDCYPKTEFAQESLWLGLLKDVLA
jgi:hypothetical protein